MIIYIQKRRNKTYYFNITNIKCDPTIIEGGMDIKKELFSEDTHGGIGDRNW